MTAQNVETPATKRLLEIDSLRGVAVLAVLTFHILTAFPELHQTASSGLYLLTLPLRFGGHGVLLFLVISGFCIHLRAARKHDPQASLNWLGFWKRRFVRLYPPYLAIMFLALLVMTLVAYLGNRPLWPPLGYTNEHFIKDLAAHLLMLHIFFLGLDAGFWNGALWSIALEEQLYILYSPFLKLRRKIGWKQILILTAVLSIVWRLVLLYNPWDPSYLSFNPGPGTGRSKNPSDVGQYLKLAPSHWFEWCLGALAAEAYVGLAKIPRWCYRAETGLAFFVLGVISEYHPVGYIFQPVCWGLTFFILLNWSCRTREEPAPTRGMIWQKLASLGLWSYSLYLVHIPVMKSVDAFLYLGFLEKNIPLRLALLVLSPLVTGWIFYLFIEKPWSARSRMVKV